MSLYTARSAIWPSTIGPNGTVGSSSPISSTLALEPGRWPPGIPCWCAPPEKTSPVSVANGDRSSGFVLADADPATLPSASKIAADAATSARDNGFPTGIHPLPHEDSVRPASSREPMFRSIVDPALTRCRVRAVTHVLAVVDDSRRSGEVVAAAQELAAAGDARLTLVAVAVVEDERPGCCDLRSGVWNRVQREVAAEQVQSARAQLAPGLRPRLAVAEGPSVEES